jgi:putative transposase
MTYSPDIHQRHSIRLKDYDYSQAGAYFVTICAWQRECLFGAIVNGEMAMNDMGRIVVAEWERTPKIRSNVELDAFTIMPNHFHAIFIVHDNIVGAHCMRPEYVELNTTHAKSGKSRVQVEDRAHVSAPLRRQSGSIGSIVAGFKSATTKRINNFRNNPGCPAWQRNYYERVIRDEQELFRAREYIVNNPLKWELDQENPVNRP